MPRKVANKSPVEPLLPVIDTAELAGDAANPRSIGDDAARGLCNSLVRFADISGIVWNKRTGELVAGHQRMQQIRAKWGDLPIRVLDEQHGLGVIEVDDAHCFVVRIVDWSKAMQRAANVAANNQKIAGEFTGDVGQYLLEVQAELSAEAPGAMDDLLLVDLLQEAFDISAGDDGGDSLVQESYQVIVQCRDEEHQRRVYDELTKDGLTCKVLTL